MTTSRTIVWFSCGAASAVAAKIAVESRQNVEVVYEDLFASEHHDNPRFLADVEHWIGQPITIIRSDKYASVDEVFEKTRYMSGIAGARCTVEMKKVPRFAFERPDDVQVFGYTADEQHRMDNFHANHPDVTPWWVLKEHSLTKGDCLARLDKAGIELPMMYRLGYRHNNCLACVKATDPKYWAKTRQDFPDAFARRAQQSRDLGVKLPRWRGKRIYLDQLPMDIPVQGQVLENISCGPECGLPFEDLTHA
jgi:hypothetical protein